jgi:hypothetical protein
MKNTVKKFPRPRQATDIKLNQESILAIVRERKRKHAEQISSSSIYIYMNFAWNSVLPLALSQPNFLHLPDRFAVV